MISTLTLIVCRYAMSAFVILGVFIGTFAESQAQSPATYAQQIYAMKMIQGNLNTVGVMGNSLTDDQMQQLTRAGHTQGVRVVIGKVDNARDISGVYRAMVGSEKVQVIWLPDPDDKMIMSSGFDFLRQNTIADRVGLYVPAADYVTNGALAAILTNGGNIEIHYNSRIAGRVGVSMPGDDSTVTFIER
jgi:hypothetical protein